MHRKSTKREQAMNERTGDILSGVVGIAFSVVLVAVATTFSEPAPRWMPWFVSGLIGVGSLILLLRRLRARDPGRQVFADVHWPVLLVLVCSWVVTVLLLETVGFYLMLMLFMAFASWYLQGCPRRIGPILKCASYAVVMSLVMWGLFTNVLGTRVPAGLAF
jgi:hypothetical protein